MGTAKVGFVSVLMIILALTRIHFLTCGFDDVNGMDSNGAFAGFGTSPLGDWIADTFDVPSEIIGRPDEFAPHVPAEAGLTVTVLR